MDPNSVTAVEMARAHISRQWPVQPRAAVILGTGLGRLVEHVQPDVMIPFDRPSGFPAHAALGHHGRVVCGRLNGVPLILLDGRCHLYEGYSLDQVTLPVRVLHACGAQLLIASNASGGLNPEFASGDIMVLDDHINLMPQRSSAGELSHRTGPHRTGPHRTGSHRLGPHRRGSHCTHRILTLRSATPGAGAADRSATRFCGSSGGVCRHDRAQLRDTCGVSLSAPHRRRRRGHVDRSRSPRGSRRWGMRVLGLSIVTNVASPDAPQVVESNEVVHAAARAEPHVRQIVADILAHGHDTPPELRSFPLVASLPDRRDTASPCACIKRYASVDFLLQLVADGGSLAVPETGVRSFRP